MAAIECGGCGQPVSDGFVCVACAFLLDAALAEVTDYQGLGWDLDLAVTRQVRFSGRGGGARSADPAVPFSSRASRAASELRTALTAWVLLAANEDFRWTRYRAIVGVVCARADCKHPSCQAGRRPRLPDEHITSLAAWLRPRVGWLRHHPSGPTALAEITTAVDTARAATNRPADKLYAGPCEAIVDTAAGDPTACSCGGQCACHSGGAVRTVCDAPGRCASRTRRPGPCRGHLYARPGAQVVVCRECGTAYDVESRRSWMLARLDDHLGNASQLSRLVAYLGIELAASSIRKYAEKARIAPHGKDSGGHPQYRLGDVVRTYYANAARSSR